MISFTAMTSFPRRIPRPILHLSLCVRQVTELEALPHWPRILHAYNSGTRDAGRSNHHPKV